ncbi:MAG: hypothetical protein IPL05_00105 [Betaproteobacteria bacterium]|nr:hypothetical protein [Betaproteobacteria bacterium]
MTANAFSEDRQRCLDAGMNDHVAKPVDPSNLYAMMIKWLPAPKAAHAASSPPPLCPADNPVEVQGQPVNEVQESGDRPPLNLPAKTAPSKTSPLPHPPPAMPNCFSH